MTSVSPSPSPRMSSPYPACRKIHDNVSSLNNFTMYSNHRRLLRYSFVLGLSISLYGQATGQTVPPSVHDTLPQALFERLNGWAEHPHGSSVGPPKAVLLDFWATYCAPCISALPKLDSLQRQFSGNLRVVTITQEKAVLAREVMQKVF